MASMDDLTSGYLNSDSACEMLRQFPTGVVHNYSCGICGSGLELRRDGRRVICANPEGSCDGDHALALP